MEEDILNHSLTVIFRETPCTFYDKLRRKMPHRGQFNNMFVKIMDCRRILIIFWDIEDFHEFSYNLG